MINCTHQPIRTLGILGGGQLGRMLAQAALPLGIRCVFLENDADCPASALGRVYSSTQLTEFAQACDALTTEFENTPLEQVDELAKLGLTLKPPRLALATAQNRIAEKTLFNELAIPTPAWKAIDQKADLAEAIEALGFPLVLKTATGGYDGKGQFVLKSVEQQDLAWAELGAFVEQGGQLIAEAFIAFEREVSIIAARDAVGQVVSYPLVENHHHQGILSHSFAPAPRSETLEAPARQYIETLLNHLDYIGVLTLELFVTPQGLVANEMAPRVHNSGHWSIEGAVCSQFENQIRAVCNLPLGSTVIRQTSVMVNVIGQHPKVKAILAQTGLHLHDYGKSARPGRKLGHITLLESDVAKQQQRLQQLAAILPEKMALPK